MVLLGFNAAFANGKKEARLGYRKSRSRSNRKTFFAKTFSQTGGEKSDPRS
jgi:hypothetical protein